jgi:hypothetical protein
LQSTWYYRAALMLRYHSTERHDFSFRTIRRLHAALPRFLFRLYLDLTVGKFAILDA